MTQAPRAEPITTGSGSWVGAPCAAAAARWSAGEVVDRDELAIMALSDP
ncbi:hypothetical protein ACFV5N_03840 [Streptomyces sp. NPDC059853]